MFLAIASLPWKNLLKRVTHNLFVTICYIFCYGISLKEEKPIGKPFQRYEIQDKPSMTTSDEL